MKMRGGWETMWWEDEGWRGWPFASRRGNWCLKSQRQAEPESGEKCKWKQMRHWKIMCTPMLEWRIASDIYRDNSVRDHLLSWWLAKVIPFLPHRNRAKWRSTRDIFVRLKRCATRLEKFERKEEETNLVRGMSSLLGRSGTVGLLGRHCKCGWWSGWKMRFSKIVDRLCRVVCCCL